MGEQIEELFSTELTKYLQSAAFQETMSQTLKSINEAAQRKDQDPEPAIPDTGEDQRQRAIFPTL